MNPSVCNCSACWWLGVQFPAAPLFPRPRTRKGREAFCIAITGVRGYWRDADDVRRKARWKCSRNYLPVCGVPETKAATQFQRFQDLSTRHTPRKRPHKPRNTPRPGTSNTPECEFAHPDPSQKTQPGMKNSRTRQGRITEKPPEGGSKKLKNRARLLIRAGYLILRHAGTAQKLTAGKLSTPVHLVLALGKKPVENKPDGIRRTRNSTTDIGKVLDKDIQCQRSAVVPIHTFDGLLRLNKPVAVQIRKKQVHCLAISFHFHAASPSDLPAPPTRRSCRQNRRPAGVRYARRGVFPGLWGRFRGSGE